MLTVRDSREGARKWGNMRLESEQLRPGPDLIADMRCRDCNAELDAAGTMDAWLFFLCRRCELVWRMTPGEVVEQIRHRAEADAV